MRVYSPLAVYAWKGLSAFLHFKGLPDPSNSLKLRDRNSSAKVILSDNDAEAAQLSRSRRLLAERDA